MSNLNKELKNYSDSLESMQKSVELCVEAKNTLLRLEQDRQFVFNKANKKLGLNGIISKMTNTFSKEVDDADRNNGEEGIG